MTAQPVKISIIVPVLNEEHSLSAASDCLRSYCQSGHEVIIVDGGSRDNTLMLAYQVTAQVVVSMPGRAMQMNSGAALATGDVLLFLHIDTRLPEDALALVRRHCHEKNGWGRFDIRLSGKQPVFRLIERLMNLRSRLSSIATGDQAIFVASSLFKKVGGFPEIALMEDIAISRALKKISRPVCINHKATTSSRRWESRGVVATVLLMWKLRLLYFLGVPPEKLARLYR